MGGAGLGRSVTGQEITNRAVALLYATIDSAPDAGPAHCGRLLRLRFRLCADAMTKHDEGEQGH